MHMVVYESYRSVYKAPFAEMLALFKAVLTDLVRTSNFFRAIKASQNFRWTYASNVPQQMGPLGDCGVGM